MIHLPRMGSTRYWSPIATLLAVLALLPTIYCVNLGIARDANTNGQKYFRWSSIATWPDDGAINNNNLLAGLAKAACKEMRADFHSDNSRDPAYVPRKQRPAVMTALRVDNTVYFSSSIKGYSFVYREKTGNEVRTTEVCDEIQLAMQRCVQTHRELFDASTGRHGNDAQCGDVMAMQQYCKAEPDNPLGGKSGILVTFNCAADPPNGEDESNDWFVSPPCKGRTNREGGQEYGCSLLLDKASVVGVEQDGTTPEEPTVEPENVRPGCIWGS